MNAAVTPLRWLSSKTLQAIQHAVLEAARGWARAWGLAQPGPVVAEAVTRWLVGGPGGLDLAGDDDPPAAWSRTVVCSLFDSDVHGSPIAAAVAADATAQLRHALRRALGLEADDMAGAAPQAALGHLGAAVRLEVLGSMWWAQAPLTALLRAGLLSPPKAKSLPRWSAEAVLATASVPMRVVLGAVPAELGDVLTLTAGDVLVLPERGLDALVNVQATGTSLQLRARLGASGGQRAIQWLTSDGAGR